MNRARVGLMGFGRIGRSIFRILHESEEIEIAAISDVADPKALAYLLGHDTILGRFPGEVGLANGTLRVGQREIPMLSGEKPGDVPWGDLGVQTVVEATARFRRRAEIEKHLEAGAHRVLLCIPPLDPPDITVVWGINESALRPDHRIVSNASCTAHAAAPVVRRLAEVFGIRRAFLTTVHAYSSQQRLADVPARNKRSGRAAAENIIPQPTNAAEMLQELLPEVRGRISGIALNVPVANGSVVDLVCWHEKDVRAEDLNSAMRDAASGRWRGILDYEEDPIVSSDIVRSPASGTFDSLSTMARGRISKTLTFYDNAWGYSHRAVDLIRRLAELDGRAS
jgi:glyceraldehyde 3-phosphate dehydrogenase